MTQHAMSALLRAELRKRGMIFDHRDVMEWAAATVPLCADDQAAACMARAWAAAIAGAAEAK
jgi:hypothetical protein